MRRPGPTASCRAVLAAAAALLGTAPGAGAAELRTVEAVGAVPLEGPSRPQGPPRSAAITEAQLEAVLRVAGEMLLDAEPGWAEDPSDSDAPSAAADPPPVEQVLGRNMTRYTRRFRIVEDRGRRPALFTEEEGVESEYVVLVEVEVDVERVRERLVEAGLLRPPGAGPPPGENWIEIVGLRRYGGYEALRRVLLEGAGASSVLPVRFARESIVLQVRSDGDARDLVARLQASVPPELSVVELGAGRDEMLRLDVAWTPPPPGSGDGR